MSKPQNSKLNPYLLLKNNLPEASDTNDIQGLVEIVDAGPGMMSAQEKDEMIQSMLPEGTDGLMDYHISVKNKNGEVIKVKGMLTVNELFSKTAISDTPQTFETLFMKTVWRSLWIKMMEYLNNEINPSGKALNTSGGMTHDHPPSISGTLAGNY